MEDVRTEGESDPVVALDAAMKLKPERIYFITGPADISDARKIKTAIDQGNKDRKIRISTILVVADAADDAKNAPLGIAVKGNRGGQRRAFQIGRGRCD